MTLQPEILLMDEPCSALDPIASGVVEDLIVRLRGRYTVVIVTHNLAQARRTGNYAAFFWVRERTGQLVEFGRCRQLFEAPAHELTAAYVQGGTRLMTTTSQTVHRQSLAIISRAVPNGFSPVGRV